VTGRRWWWRRLGRCRAARRGHADADGYGEVGEDGEGEGGEPDGDVGFGEAEDGGDLAPLAHVVGDDEEDGGEGGEGDEAGERRGEQQD
jgi:hypothetical protein